MTCQFKNEEGKCYLCKKQCGVLEGDISLCKYYKRQFPENREVFVSRVKESLEKVSKRRDILKTNPVIEVEKLINFRESIYDNVRFIIDAYPSLKVVYKIKKKVNTSVLMERSSNPVDAIYNNLYETKTLEIIERYDDSNEVMIKDEGRKYICKIKPKLDEFFHNIEKKKKGYDYLSKSIKEIKPI